MAGTVAGNGRTMASNVARAFRVSWTHCRDSNMVGNMAGSVAGSVAGNGGTMASNVARTLRVSWTTSKNDGKQTVVRSS